jgi:hypothetical protein
VISQEHPVAFLTAIGCPAPKPWVFVQLAASPDTRVLEGEIHLEIVLYLLPKQESFS